MQLFATTSGCSIKMASGLTISMISILESSSPFVKLTGSISMLSRTSLLL